MQKKNTFKNWVSNYHLDNFPTKQEGANKMNIQESAQAWEPPQSRNIAELKKVSVKLELKKGEGKDNDNETFSYQYFEQDGIKWRVPGSVLGGLKGIMEKMPNLKYFAVIKTGTGMGTKYQVIPHIEEQKEEKV